MPEPARPAEPTDPAGAPAGGVVPPKVIAPTPGRDDAWFWAELDDGRLVVQACTDCGVVRHPPSPMCGECGSLRWEARRATGRGTVHTWIVSRHPTLDDQEPRVVAVVELEEGVRLVANVVEVDVDAVVASVRGGDPDAAPVRDDMAVRFVPRVVGDVVLPAFVPDDSGLAPATPLTDLAAASPVHRSAPARRGGALGGPEDPPARRWPVIAGIGHTEYSKDSGRSVLQLAAEAVRAALDDAGLAPADVDGLVTFTADTTDELELMRAVGIDRIGWWSRTPHGGAGSHTTVQHAAAAVASGAAETVVVYRAFNERSERRFGQPNQRVADGLWNWALPFGLDTPAKIYALWFQRYMHRYGLTNADFGRYTVVARAHAATNPDAWYYERPLTHEEHQASRWIVEPILRKLDCCQESDGGVALVVTSAGRAADLASTPVRIAAAADAQLRGGHVMFNYHQPDLTRFAEAEALAERLYATAGVGPADVDVAMLYENFSPIVFLQLEAFGFCGPGEAKDLIASGGIGLGGTIPVNTNGGLLGEAYIHGMNNILEGVRQVRGTAANQIAGAETVLVTGGRSGLLLTPTP